MSAREKILSGAAAFSIGACALGTAMPVLADSAGAFIGGVFAAKVLDNMSRRTEAEEYQAAAAARQPVYVTAPAPAAPPQKSPEERIKELDKLAAGGYITPEEYKAKKQQILDSM